MIRQEPHHADSLALLPATVRRQEQDGKDVRGTARSGACCGRLAVRGRRGRQGQRRQRRVQEVRGGKGEEVVLNMGCRDDWTEARAGG